MTNISNLDEREKLAQPWKDRWTVLWWAIEDFYAVIQYISSLNAFRLEASTGNDLKSELQKVESGSLNAHREQLSQLIDTAVTLNTVQTGRALKPDAAFQKEQFQLIEKLQELISQYSKTVYDTLEFNLIITEQVKPTKYSTNYALSFFFEQITTDLTTLQQAFVQRFLLSNHVGWTEYILYLGDQLANHALKPAEKNHFISESSAVICHLDKQLNIRLIPYANVVFIGLPPNLLPTDFEMTYKMSTDFLAIAHEIGHFIYWQGQAGPEGEPLHTTIPQKIKALTSITENDWRLRWLEELFADVYACLVAGPVIALEFQRLLLDNLPEHFKIDREKHPIDELRPYILNNILRKITDNNGNLLYTNAPAALDQVWEDKNPNRTAKTNQYSIKGAEASLSGSAIITALDPIINELLSILQPLWPATANEPWTHDITQNSDVGSLYTQFKSRHFGLLKSKYDHDNDFDPHNHSSKIFKATSNAHHIKDRDSDTYLESVLFRGWSVEGPEGEINPD